MVSPLASDTPSFSERVWTIRTVARNGCGGGGVACERRVSWLSKVGNLFVVVVDESRTCCCY